MARLAPLFGAFGSLRNCQFSNLIWMQPLLYLSCADDARRAAIADALARCGLELTDSANNLATLHILDDAEGLQIRNDDEIVLQLSGAATPDDVAELARVGLQLMALWTLARSYEDCDSIGVIAIHVATEARNALVPVTFAAEALALGHPAARELQRLVVNGCKRAMSILERIAPNDSVGPAPAMCVNTVISQLASAMRVIARDARLAIRLYNPLPQVAIDRATLERMVLTLVANAAEATHLDHIVVATSSSTIADSGLEQVPAGEWVVIEVEDDSDRERVLPVVPISPSSSSGHALPNIARAARSAGGHVTVETGSFGTRIRLWLPCVDSATASTPSSSVLS
jgi:nitrogen-specific signal transduction histidine kinase